MRTRRWSRSERCSPCARRLERRDEREDLLRHHADLLRQRRAPHRPHLHDVCWRTRCTRYHRLCGEDTFFLTGSDEHGEKVLEVAAARGESPQRGRRLLLDAIFRADLGAARHPLRSLHPHHRRRITRESVQHRSCRRCTTLGWTSSSASTRALYCVGCERFLTDRDLVDGNCRDHERAPEPRSESNYFFKMSDPLRVALAVHRRAPRTSSGPSATATKCSAC